jgi:3-oxoacyl-[acyl-carrier protein] reductase
MEIANKTALVLGATRGIGRAIARALAHKGARIVAPYFDWPESCQETIIELQKISPDHIFIKTDLRDGKQVENLFKQIKIQCGSLDILINNIERGGMPIVHGQYTDEQWELEMNTTLKAKWHVFQHALPLLKKASEGVVVNFSSIAGVVGRSGPAGLIFNDAYAAANRAVSSFNETWARQGAPSVRVNELMLGFIEGRHGPGTRGWDLLSEERQKAIEGQTLLQRTGKITEVLDAVLFLIQDASFMTGARLTFDGGFLLGHDSVPEIPERRDNLEVQAAQDIQHNRPNSSGL